MPNVSSSLVLTVELAVLIVFTLLVTLCGGVTNKGVKVSKNDPVTLKELAEARIDPKMLSSHKLLPQVLAAEYSMVERKALFTLLDAMQSYLKQNAPITNRLHPRPFQDVLVAYMTPSEVVHPSDGKGEDVKYFIGNSSIHAAGKDYIVYAGGINGVPTFENYMASLGSTVHGFDCTDSNRPTYKFEFHPWCIGVRQISKDTDRVDGTYAAMVGGNKGPEFYTFAQIKRRLGHKKVDLFKFDIEGFEWDLLYSEIVNGEEVDLPEQLLFELHTEGASATYVPPTLVRLHRHHQVNVLFYRLWKKGYRVIHKEGNVGDRHCMEFSLIRLH
jgi:hypothetical protein